LNFFSNSRVLCFGNSKEDELGKWWGSMDYHHYGGVGQGGGDYFVLLNRAQRKANLSTILLVTKYSNNFEKNA